jgi:D-tyrosyl-tRNA(Tyr) deacylase
VLVKIVIQRVSSAGVTVAGRREAVIGPGLLVLVGVEKGDDAARVETAAEKIVNLRIFSAQPGTDERMERSVLETAGEILVVSQFTLAGSLRKGRRPSFDGAAPHVEAQKIYLDLVHALRNRGARVATGVFRAMMDVDLVNTGPVTFIMDSAP